MENQNFKISVILPSLNVKQYIEQCIESVLNQTLEDIEIICVDAGSDDGTLEILKKYSELDSRIKLIHSDIKSYGHQLNLAIEQSKGEYIGIVETDDYIDENMYEVLYDLTDNGVVDISKVNFYHFYDVDPLEPEFREDGTKKNLPKDKFIVFDNADILNGHPSIWAAIYRKNFLIENNINFMEAPGGGWVDNPFLFKTMLAAKSITYKDKPYYYYRELNPNSSTNKMSDLKLPMKRMMNNLDVVEEFSCDNENVLTALYVRIFWHVNDLINKINFDEQEEDVLKSINAVFKRLDEDIILKRFKLPDQKLYYKYLSLLNIIDSTGDGISISCEDFENINREKEFLYSRISSLERNNKQLSNDKKKLNQKNKKLISKIKNIENSKSFKLGSMMVSPLRKVRKLTNNKKNTLVLPKKNNTRVLFISSDNNRTSGAFLSMANLITILRDKYNLDIFVILPNEGHGSEILDNMNIPYLLINSKDWVIPLNKIKDEIYYKEIDKKKYINEKAIKKISEFIKLNDVDLLHINTTYSYVGAKAALENSVPFVWHLREFLEEDQSNTLWDRKKGNELINRANNIIAISDSIYKKYENTFDKNRLVRIYNGIDANKFYKPDKSILNNEKIIFIMVGGFEYYKGQLEFAEACVKLYSNGYENFEVWFIGTGRKDVQNEVENIFSSANMTNVRFIGYKSNVEDYYNKADISFTCAKSEAFGRTTVEAMLSGNLIIGADSAGTKELIDDGKTGFLYKHGDSTDLYEKMVFAIENIESSKEIAQNGRVYMFENMTSEKNADNIYDLYKSILNKI